MAADSRSSSPTRPLLEEVQPPSYQAITTPTDPTRSPTPNSEYSDEDVPPPHKVTKTSLYWVLLGMWSAVFLGAFDGTVVATLLTPIGSEYNAMDQASYIGTSYLLSVCCFTPLYGRLADIVGRKGAMLIALSLFGSGTVFCGLAPSMPTLIAARAVSGMGGGGVMTVSNISVSDMVPLKQRGLYQGMANILFGLGSGLGGPVGGWVNDNYGWQAAFLMQAPLLLLSFIIVALKVDIPLAPEVQQQSNYEKLRRIDWLGSLTLVMTVGSLLLGCSLKTQEQLAWSDPLVSGLLLASVISAILFVLVEKHWAALPVMPLHLISRRTPLAVSIANFLGSMTAFSTLYNAPLYFAAVRLENAATSGLHLMPHSVCISTGSVFAGWYMRRTGKLYSLTLISAGLTLLASVLIASWNENSSQFHLWLDLVPQGFGMASLLTTTLIAMIASVYQEEIAVATGITYLFRTSGQVLGVSLSGAVLQAVLLNKLRERIHGPNAVEIIDNIRRSAEVIPHLDPELQKAAVDSYADAIRVVFICHIGINILCFLSCLPIQENPLPATREEHQERDRNQASDPDDAEP